MRPKKTEREQVEQTLRRIESQTSEQKKRKAMQILTAQPKKISATSAMFEVIKKKVQQRAIFYSRQARLSENKHIFTITVFFLFSTYTAWQIQEKYDVMRRKATVTQTYKQDMIEKENQYINRMLTKKEFQAVPIPDEMEGVTKYKFEENDKPDSDVQFDTKDQLLEAMAIDYRKGMPLEVGYQDELRRKNMI